MNEIKSPTSPATPYVHAWHYDMLISHERSEFYRDLIKENCQDKIVLEIGTGAGLLAVLAIKYGAKQVICCEENAHLANVAQELFTRLGLNDRIRLIRKNSTEISADEIPKVDVVLHELFGSDPFGEDMVPTLKDARRFMKPEAIFLPEKIQLIYRPILTRELPEKVAFEDIELLEMTKLLSEIHPSLRKRDPQPADEFYTLPVVSIPELLEKPYTYTVVNDKLIDVDVIEVSFFIIHGQHKFQAAKFENINGRVHWFPLHFYKVDEQDNKISFFVKDQNQLQAL